MVEIANRKVRYDAKKETGRTNKFMKKWFKLEQKYIKDPTWFVPELIEETNLFS